jgi:hypothetical protein
MCPVDSWKSLRECDTKSGTVILRCCAALPRFQRDLSPRARTFCPSNGSPMRDTLTMIIVNALPGAEESGVVQLRGAARCRCAARAWHDLYPVRTPLPGKHMLCTCVLGYSWVQLVRWCLACKRPLNTRLATGVGLSFFLFFSGYSWGWERGGWGAAMCDPTEWSAGPGAARRRW